MLERLFPQQADDRLFVEDVFSTWLYTGGSVQTITNGIDLAGKGGLVWIKSRGSADDHYLYDTNRGVNIDLNTNGTNPNQTVSGSLTSFGSSGFTLGTNEGGINGGGGRFVSWTFRKAPKFFDIVTWTGNGSNRDIAHNLGIEPGMIVVKRTSGASVDWQIYHISRGANQVISFNSNSGFITNTNWNNTTPTATNIRIGTSSTVNAFGETYVAYLFAHDPSADGLIQCGGYSGNGSTAGPTLNLGWEPQWVMIKNASLTGNWHVADNMRGMPVGSADTDLIPNSSAAEQVFDWISPTATGFQITSSGVEFNQSGQSYIYMAIRRGPMRTPTLGTSVFLPVAAVSGAQTTGFPVDMQLERLIGSSSNTLAHDRLRGVVTTDSNSPSPALYTNTTNSEITGNNASKNWGSTGFTVPSVFSGGSGIYWNFRRAPGFFDEVCYTGTGVARTVNHNLGVAPELMIVKSRSGTFNWMVYSASLGNTKRLFLDLTNAESSSSPTNGSWNDTSPTSSVFSVGDIGAVNASAATFVAYLFASVPGVSKVGSYTGNGSSQTINCAFTTGARFVLIKRTDSTGDWYVWDSARGIVAGNDPYLALNSTAAEVTSNDSVDTDSTGFVVNQVAASNINVNAATYIFLAIA